MKTLKEISIEKGVPMPDTCKGLNWQNETFFYWQEYELKCGDVDYALYIKNKQTYILIWAAFDTIFANGKQFIPAPQMHEIIPLLPTTISYNEITHYLDVKLPYYIKYESDYLPFDVIESKCVIKDNHYVEAFANLYLKLKNLLPK